MPMRAGRLVGALLEPTSRTFSIWWVWVGGVWWYRRLAAAGEALDAEQLLGVQAAVVPPELRVALVRDVAAADVEHRRALSPATDRCRSRPMVIDRETAKGARADAASARRTRSRGSSPWRRTGAPFRRRCGSGGTARRWSSTRSATSRSFDTSRPTRTWPSPCGPTSPRERARRPHRRGGRSIRPGRQRRGRARRLHRQKYRSDRIARLGAESRRVRRVATRCRSASRPRASEPSSRATSDASRWRWPCDRRRQPSCRVSSEWPPRG